MIDIKYRRAVDILKSKTVILPSGCHIYTGSLTTNGGYGQVGGLGKGKIVKAHRLAWMIENDQDVPKGGLICHTCDIPSCVNPDHLYSGSALDNMADRVARNPNSYKHGSNRLFTGKEKDSLISEYLSDPYMTYAMLADNYGCSVDAVQLACKGVNKPTKWRKSPLTESQKSEICNLRPTHTLAKLAGMFGVGQSTIHRTLHTG